MLELVNQLTGDWRMSVDKGVVSLSKGHNTIEYSHNGDGIDYLYTYSGAVRDTKSKVNVTVSDIAEIINYGDTKHDEIIHNSVSANYSLRGHTVSELNNQLIIKNTKGDVVYKPHSIDEAISFIKNID